VSFSKEDLTHMAGRLQQIVNKLAPEATKLCRELNGPSANCDMRISLSSKGKGINAHADGKKIVVNAALIDFAESDSHLAFVIAHEYTHHMMRHVSSTQQNVMAGGLL
jgi:predicted Zn-dependent protease